MILCAQNIALAQNEIDIQCKETLNACDDTLNKCDASLLSCLGSVDNHKELIQKKDELINVQEKRIKELDSEPDLGWLWFVLGAVAGGVAGAALKK